MPTFAFEAMNSSGQEVKEEIDAASSEEAIAKIRGKGYFPTKVREKAAKKGAKKKKGGGAEAGRRQGGGAFEAADLDRGPGEQLPGVVEGPLDHPLGAAGEEDLRVFHSCHPDIPAIEAAFLASQVTRSPSAAKRAFMSGAKWMKIQSDLRNCRRFPNGWDSKAPCNAAMRLSVRIRI